MSGVGFKLQTAQVATGTSKKTIIQAVAAANHGLKIRELSISFKGVSNTDAPILVEVTRQSSAGTMTSLTPTKEPNDDSAETLQVTGQHTSTSEPTEVSVVKAELVHPQTGFLWQPRFGEDIKVGGGDRLAIAVTATVDVNCVARIEGDE